MKNEESKQVLLKLNQARFGVTIEWLLNLT